MPARTDDLLRPTLDPGLDVRAFGRLFRPQSILWATFFGGPIAGGILFGINYKRMGRRDLARRCLIGAVALAVVLALVLAWFYLRSRDPDLPAAAVATQRRIMRLATSAVSIAVGWFVAQHQMRRFTAWENAASNQPASLWGPGILAVLGGGFAMFVAIMGAIVLLHALE